MAGTTTPNYEIDYNDERFTNVEKEFQQDITESQHIYDGMINQTDKFYQDQVDSLKDWSNTQQQIQQEQTDFAIEKIEQEKKKSETDYIKEQSGAYVDWQKQSNQYGAEAEKMASAGLTNTGFAESSQVAMYNQYQNRVATARQNFDYIVMNYNNMIKDAQLQNSAAMAEIAFQTQQQCLELALQGFQYKNDLLLAKADKITELKNTKWQKEMAILDQMNTENALKENVRQFNENLAFQTEQNQLDRDQKDRLQKEQQAFEAEQNRLDREQKDRLEKENQDFLIKLEGIKDKYAREQAKTEHEYKIKQINAEYAAKQALAQKEYELAQAQIKKNTSSSGGMNAKQLLSVAKKAAGITGKTSNTTTSSIPTDWDGANAYMKKNGVPSAYANGMKSRHEFTRSPTSEDFKTNKGSYETYVQNYVRWHIAEFGSSSKQSSTSKSSSWRGR